MTFSALISPLREFCVVYPARRRFIALSGGLDSVVLLHLAAQAFPDEPLYAIHVNHGLQVEADQWQAFCERLCAQLNVRLFTHRVVLASASEQAARDARYGVFASHLEKHDQLLLAHHQNDQAETLLFRLMRGAGLRGLSAMAPHRRLGEALLLRPLLGYSRQTLEAIAQEQGYDWCEDPSNRSDTYARNYLRHQILPRLSARWSAVSQLAHVTDLLRDDLYLLESYLDDELALVTTSAEQLNLDLLGNVPEPRQLPLLRHWIYRATGVLINVKDLTDIAHMFLDSKGDAQPQRQLAGWVLRRYRQNLYLLRPATPSHISLPVFTEGQFQLPHGELEVARSTGGLSIRSAENLTWALAGEGRSCRPAGRPNKTLKKLFQEAGVPPWQRRHWPVLLDGEHVAAVAGICVCDGYQISEQGIVGFQIKWQPF
ncbi:tRNA lysidine(34) synthetase TilS [Neptunomonas sp. XY-337]|uniref:tRNA lysidine(34) synthetase TilS n=1 Tax=Neptunomonas sp. XY-337 TaxID=2561897 RepID=UPI0010AA805B|nr:tRNA lysidine(34) synthetase TilS [Neptunomonas sp. XY-337]